MQLKILTTDNNSRNVTKGTPFACSTHYSLCSDENVDNIIHLSYY